MEAIPKDGAEYIFLIIILGKMFLFWYLSF